MKGDGSRSLAKRIAAGECEAPQISALVEGWFRHHGADVRYRPGLADAFAPIGAVPSDVQKRLKWIKEAVTPSLRWLQQWYSEDELHAFLFDGAQLLERGGKEGLSSEFVGGRMLEMASEASDRLVS